MWGGASFSVLLSFSYLLSLKHRPNTLSSLSFSPSSPSFPPSFPSLSPPHFPDPFTMLDVAPEDVKPMTELKQEIEAWLQAQKEEAAKQAAALAP